MAGKMSGMKGMGAAKMKGRFTSKKKKKAVKTMAKADDEGVADTAIEPKGEAAAQADGDLPTLSKKPFIKKRMTSETY